MSSLYSTTLQKILESVGALKTTQDPIFLAHLNNLITMGQLAEVVKENIIHYINAIVLLCNSAYRLSVEFKNCYEKDLKQIYTPVSLKNEMEVGILKEEKCDLLLKHVTDKIQYRLALWIEFLYEMQRLVQIREDYRLQYDHYARKILNIRKEYEDVINKGAAEALQDTQRRIRNEKKFEDAKSKFTLATNIAINALDNAWRQRFLWINPIFTEILKTQIFFSDTIAKVHNIMGPQLKAARDITPPTSDLEDPVYVFNKYKEFKAGLKPLSKEDADTGFFSFFHFGGTNTDTKPTPQFNIEDELNAFTKALPSQCNEAFLAPSVLLVVGGPLAQLVPSAAKHVAETTSSSSAPKLVDDDAHNDTPDHKVEKQVKKEEKKVEKKEEEKKEDKKEEKKEDKKEEKKKDEKEKKKKKDKKKKVESEESGDDKPIKAKNADLDLEPGSTKPVVYIAQTVSSFDDWDFAAEIKPAEPIVQPKESKKPAISSPFDGKSNIAPITNAPKKAQSNNPFDDLISELDDKPSKPVKNVKKEEVKNPFDFDLS